MQVTLKTLQQQTFKIDIDPEETVRAEGSAGPGRARWGRGEHEGSAGRLGLGGGCGRRRGSVRGPLLSSEQGWAARPSGDNPRVHRESSVCVGLGPQALDEA